MLSARTSSHGLYVVQVSVLVQESLDQVVECAAVYKFPNEPFRRKTSVEFLTLNIM